MAVSTACAAMNRQTITGIIPYALQKRNNIFRRRFQ